MRPSSAGLFAAIRAGDADAVRRLLATGANPRLGDDRESTLHAAARGDSAAVVEALLEGGALEWDRDADGRLALEVAREHASPARAAIVALLDRERIDDASFRAAVDAVHAGDLAALRALLDAEPRLSRDRIVQHDVYRRAARSDYFRDPKLLWFVAWNPSFAGPMPADIAAIALEIVRRGVEQSDLDYTLGLVMSSSVAREQGQQESLMRALLASGAVAGRDEILIAAAHRELEPLRLLIELGHAVTAPIAAALGDDAALALALRSADAEAVQDAFSLAVLNGRVASARMALDAGADVGARMAVHRHGTALHSAAAADDAAMIELLLARGARTDVRDTLWDATPLDWAKHQGHDRARAALELATAT